eukprot:2110138-Pyramimonas_sp.AAC.1
MALRTMRCLHSQCHLPPSGEGVRRGFNTPAQLRQPEVLLRGSGGGQERGVRRGSLPAVAGAPRSCTAPRV